MELRTSCAMRCGFSRVKKFLEKIVLNQKIYPSTPCAMRCYFAGVGGNFFQKYSVYHCYILNVRGTDF